MDNSKKTKLYLCPDCKSHEIYKIGHNFSCKIDDQIIRMVKGNYFCRCCLEQDLWRLRLKVRNEQENYNLSKLTPICHESELVPYTFPFGVNESRSLTNDGFIWNPKYQSDFSHWTHGFDWYGVWAPYNGWRFKDRYDLVLWDDSRFSNAYPNGDSWYVSGVAVGIPDTAVRFIRLKPTTELDEIWSGDDEAEFQTYREARNVQQFGKNKDSWVHKDKSCWEPITKHLNNKE